MPWAEMARFINQTPNLDRIAQNGMRFNNCFCTNALCEPSRATILTGTYNHINEVTTIGAHLDNRQENAAKTVRADALLEFRMNYTNLVTRSFATSHRAQDSPLDFDHIRRMCTRLKSYMINPEAGRQGNLGKAPQISPAS